MLSIAAIVLLILIGIMSIPLTLTFKISWPQTVQNDVSLKWAFGIVQMRLPRLHSRSLQSRSVESKESVETDRTASYDIGQVFSVVRQRMVRQRILNFVTDLWHAVHRDNLYLGFRIGLDDPADTGQLWAMIGPISGVLATLKQTSIYFEPDFSDAIFDFNSTGTIRLIPLQIIYLTLVFLLSPITWKTVRQIRAART